MGSPRIPHAIGTYGKIECRPASRGSPRRVRDCKTNSLSGSVERIDPQSGISRDNSAHIDILHPPHKKKHYQTSVQCFCRIFEKNRGVQQYLERDGNFAATKAADTSETRANISGLHNSNASPKSLLKCQYFRPT